MRFYLNSVQFRPTFVFQWITFVSIAEATGCLMQSYLINNDGRPREHCNHFILNAYYAQFKADCSMHRCNRRRTLQRLAIVQYSGWIRGRGGATGQASCTRYLYWHVCICVFVYLRIFALCRLGWVWRGGEGDQSNGACMMGIFDIFVFFISVHICVYLYLCICGFVYLYFFSIVQAKLEGGS